MQRPVRVRKMLFPVPNCMFTSLFAALITISFTNMYSIQWKSAKQRNVYKTWPDNMYRICIATLQNMYQRSLLRSAPKLIGLKTFSKQLCGLLPLQSTDLINDCGNGLLKWVKCEFHEKDIFYMLKNYPIMQYGLSY